MLSGRLLVYDALQMSFKVHTCGPVVFCWFQDKSYVQGLNSNDLAFSKHISKTVVEKCFAINNAVDYYLGGHYPWGGGGQCSVLSYGCNIR